MDKTMESEQKAAAVFDRMAAELEANQERSAWNKGVNVYAQELLEGLRERAEDEGRLPESIEECQEWLLNGAESWDAYSFGGNALIYDGDIAQRLCTPSELKKTHNGERLPNGQEQWLGVQARALSQACDRVTSLYSQIAKEHGAPEKKPSVREQLAQATKEAAKQHGSPGKPEHPKKKDMER